MRLISNLQSQTKKCRQKLSGMNKQQKFFAFLLTLCLVLGVGKAWADLAGYGKSGPAVAPNSLDLGLVGHWNMEEGGGQVVKDRSISGNDGTLGNSNVSDTNDPSFVPGMTAAGPVGSALKFDGQDDYTNLGNKSVYNLAATSHTFSVWVKINSVVGKDSARIFDRFLSGAPGAGYYLGVKTTGNLVFQENSSGGDPISFTSAQTYNDDRWHQISLVTDTNLKKGKLYVDGVFIGEDIYVGNLLNYDDFLYIGGKANTYSFPGAIDEFRIYNRALTDDEVELLYNQKKPVAAYYMDEGTGTVLQDNSFNKLNGSLGASPAMPMRVTGKYGGALQFDGVDDNVSVPHSALLALTSKVSLSAWINPTGKFGTDNWNRIISKGTATDGYVLAVQDSDNNGTLDKVVARAGVNTLAGDINLPFGAWSHLEMTYDGVNVAVYQNGNLIKSAAATGAINAGTEDLAIGCSKVGTTYGDFFKGTIDAAEIYSYARTAEEVRSDFNYSLAFHVGVDGDDLARGMVAYWDMEEGSGQIVKDKSSNGNDGVLGASTSADTNDPAFAPGITSAGENGNSLRFDGNNDYVNAGNASSLQITGNLSVGIWVQTSDVPIIAKRLISKDNASSIRSWALQMTNTGTVAFYVWRGGVIQSSGVSSVSINDGKWHYVMGVNDGTNLMLYVDGIKCASATVGGAIDNAAVNVFIGSRSALTAGGMTMNGSLDEARIYNRAISDEEIRRLYNLNRPALDLRFAEGSGSATKDISLNKSVGVVYGTNGMVTAATSTTISDSAKSWAVNEWADESVTIIYGTGAGQTRTIVSNTVTDLTISAAWATTPDTTSAYSVTSKKEWAVGKSDTAIDFDGADDYVDMGDIFRPSRTNNRTYSFWVNPRSLSSPASTVFNVGNSNSNTNGNAQFYFTNTGAVTVNYEFATAPSKYEFAGAGPNLNIWTHYEMTMDVSNASNTVVKIYRNGILVGSITQARATSTQINATLTLGASTSVNNTKTNFFNGLIDDFKVYEYKRSESEIRQDYNGNLAARLGKNNQRLDWGLVGYWDMEEGRGQTIKDKSGNGNDGTLGSSAASDVSDPVFAAGFNSGGFGGSALKFDGTNDYVNVGNGSSLQITGDLSVGMWIKVDENPSVSKRLISKDDFSQSSWTMQLNNLGRVVFNVWRGGVMQSSAFSNPITDGLWHYVMGVNDGASLSIYVDGIKRSTASTGGSIDLSNTNVAIGSKSGTPATTSIKALIDETRIYNRALSEDEIRQLYNQKKPDWYWKFSEGSGNKTKDVALQSNASGTIYGLYRGAATGATANTLTDATQNWPINGWAGQLVTIIGGTGVGQTRTIVSNTNTELTIDTFWGTIPDTTSAFALSSANEWVSGKADNTLNYDGNNCVDFGNILPPDRNVNRTYSFWIYPRAVGAKAVFGTGNSFVGYGMSSFFSLYSDVMIMYDMQKALTFTGARPTLNAWNHYAFTADVSDPLFTTITLYKDGNLVESRREIRNTSGGSFASFTVGCRRYGAKATFVDFFDGMIDEFKVYNYKRTADEIKVDYNMGQAARLR